MIDIYEYMHYEYAFVIMLIIYLIAMATLKIKYGFWHNQPLSFRYSPYWWWHRSAPQSRPDSDAAGSSSSSSSYLLTTQYNLSNTFTSISSGTTKAVIFPFIHNVNYKHISVYYNRDRFPLASEISRCNDITSIPFEQIAQFLNTTRPPVAPAASAKFIEPFVDFERFSQTITNDTHGLSPFIGVYHRPTYVTAGLGIGSTIDAITEVQGVSVLLPRQKIEYDADKRSDSSARTTTIYVCDHFQWNPLLLNDHESLELLETTEYIQKSREIAGELTLYRYNDIPPFIVPFSTCYTYGISLEQPVIEIRKQVRVGVLLVKVSTANFNLFYNFIIECSRDFRCSILHPISHIQHLVDTGIYHIYMLVINKTLVISAYIFGPSWSRCIEKDTPGSAGAGAGAGAGSRRGRRKMQTQRDRIEHVRERIAETSTALVKYLPPVEVPQYDISGKRIKSLEHSISSGEKSDKNKHKNGKRHGSMATVAAVAAAEIPRLISSMKHKLNCDNDIFLYGFIEASRDLTASLYKNVKSNGITSANILMIDTIADNYILLDELNKRSAPLWIDKWYYVMYNAYIRTELLCKYLFMV